MPHAYSSDHPHKRRRERHIRIVSELKSEPDLQRIADTITDLILYLAETGQTLEQYQAATAQHRELEAALRHTRWTRPAGQPLSGCMCRQCTTARDTTSGN